MAKAKKEAVLTPEERLQAALVPDWEWPYKLPENWCWTNIRSICTLINGKAFKPTDWSEYGLPIVRIQNLNNPSADFNFYAGNVEDAFLLKGDELLFAWSGTPGTSFGAHIWWGKEAVLNQHIFKVKFDELLINKMFLKHAINQQLDWLISAAHGGAGLQHVTKGVFESTPVPLPPLAEQQRIVDRIESLFAKLDEAKEKAQAVVDSFETRKAAVLHKAFTGELTANWREEHSIGMDSWESCRFGELGVLERGRSKHRPRNDPQLFGGKYPFIQTGDVARSGMYVTEHTQTLSEIGMAQSKIFPKGTLCITIAANIGDVSILTYDCCFPDSVVGFTPNGKTSSKYIYYMMSTIQRELEANAPATAQKNINLKILDDIQIIIPSLAEQTEIVSQLEYLFGQEQQAKEAAEAVLDQIDLMKKSILARAFRGELGTNDPKDEPAVELIKTVLQQTIEQEIPPKKPRNRKDSRKEENIVAKTILEVLAVQKKATPEDLKKTTSLDIDDFYDQVKTLIASNNIVETRDGNEVFLEVAHANRQAED